MQLEELIEQSALDAEKCVRDSQLLDYAWMKDQREVAAGRPPQFLDAAIDRQYAELLGELSGNGTDPQA